MTLVLQKIGNKSLVQILGFIRFLYFVEVENLQEMESIGKQFKVNKNLHKNKLLKLKSNLKMLAIIQVKIIFRIKELQILMQNQTSSLFWHSSSIEDRILLQTLLCNSNKIIHKTVIFRLLEIKILIFQLLITIYRTTAIVNGT